MVAGRGGNRCADARFCGRPPDGPVPRPDAWRVGGEGAFDMRVAANKQVWWWSGVGVVLALALWRLGTVMTPFLLGAGVAYVLDPVADRLERTGLSRQWSVGLITIVAALAVILVILLVGPILLRQIVTAIEGAPAFLQATQEFLATKFPRLAPEGGAFDTAINNAAAAISENGAAVLGTVLTSLGNVLGVVALLVIVPVVAFYLLLDWDRMIERVDEMLPREHAPSLRRIAGDIDESLSGFLRGQGLVTLILGSFYATGLFAVGLPFGLIIGMMAAVLSIIPYVGVFIGGLTAMTVAVIHFWNEPFWIGAVAAIFAFGQFVEGNFLQPRIIGGHVGLHPVWLMIALSVFGTLFGFVGLIVAVPLAAMVGVVTRFLAARYKESAVYTGREIPPAPQQPTLIELVPRGTVAETRRRAEAAKAVAVAELRIEDARREALRVAEETAKASGSPTASAAVAVIADPRVDGIAPEVVAVSPAPAEPNPPGRASPVRTATDQAELEATDPQLHEANARRVAETQIEAEITARAEEVKALARDAALAALSGADAETGKPGVPLDQPLEAPQTPVEAAEQLFHAGDDVVPTPEASAADPAAKTGARDVARTYPGRASGSEAAVPEDKDR